MITNDSDYIARLEERLRQAQTERNYFAKIVRQLAKRHPTLVAEAARWAGVPPDPPR